MPILLLLFLGSGAAALIYEIVWYQLLQFVIGSTAVSLGVLLATFMGGLCIGSLILPRVLSAKHSAKIHPLRIYGAIEFLIGLLGLMELLVIPMIGQAYLIGPQAGFAGILFRGLVAAVCLLPPTILMGASLPAVARWIEGSARGASWCGLLYGANTLGAVSGCLIAGFFLLRLFDVNVATFAAVALNLTMAAIAILMASKTPSKLLFDEASEQTERIGEADSTASHWPVYLATALSGGVALGAEVVWTRLMGLMLGSTVYTFSIILAVFLVGLAIGAVVASGPAKRINSQVALGWCQIFAAAGIGWTAYMIADALPYWPVNPQLPKSAVSTFSIDMARTMMAIFPATWFWGASLPFAFAATASREHDSGATVGRVYAANTAGAILGALSVSLFLIPSIGTQNTQRLLLIVSGLSGFLLLVPLTRQARTHTVKLSLGVAFGLVALLGWKIHKVPDELIAYGRYMREASGGSKILYTAEGRNTSIAISQWNDGAVQFHVAGRVEASTEMYDMKLQRMLGHLPGLIHPDPHSVLVVGFGGGVTAGTFTTYPSMQRLVICELEPLIPAASARYFAKQNHHVMSDRRTEIVYDDARHFVAATREKFDIITSDPVHPFVKGSATLYSQEYFEMVKAHLNPGGVVSQWVPLYESDAATVQSEIATFFEVFPYGTLWANTLDGQGYDLVLVGQLTPPSFNLDSMQVRLDRSDHAGVKQSLREVKVSSVEALLSTYSGNRADIQPWLKGAAINRDKNLRLQYLAGLALNGSDEDAIYRQIMHYWVPPIGLFSGSPQRLHTLFFAWAVKERNRSQAAPAPGAASNP